MECNAFLLSAKKMTLEDFELYKRLEGLDDTLKEDAISQLPRYQGFVAARSGKQLELKDCPNPPKYTLGYILGMRTKGNGSRIRSTYKRPPKKG